MDLIAQLKHSDWRVRANAADALSENLDDAAIAALVEALNDSRVEVASAAAGSLKLASPVPIAALPALMALARRGETNAIDAIASIGSAAAEAVPQLLELLPVSDDPISILGALEAIGRTPPSALPVIMSFLEHEDDFVKIAALGVMGEMERDAGPAIEKICTTMAEGEEFVPVYGGLALWKIMKSFEPGLSRLTSELRDSDEYHVRRLSAEVLGGTTPDERVLAALENAMRDEDAFVRYRAAEAIWNLINDARVITPILRQLQKADEPGVRRLAAELEKRIASHGEATPHAKP
jgi:HEAT repeat protein